MPEIYIIFITLLSLVYFLALYIFENGLNKIKIPKIDSNIPKNYKVSVIVCARNEEKNLPDLFTCLENQKVNDIDIEYIIVNDRSEDKTAELIASQIKKSNKFKTINIKDRIAGFAPKKRAIDSAIKIAKGDLILLTDADGRPQKEWVRSMVSYFENGADMIIGYAPYNVSKQSGIIKKMLALEYFSIAIIAASTAQLGYPVTCVGTNMAYRKKVYNDVGGFGKFKSFISGDDDLFLTIVRGNGNYNIRYAASSLCHVYNNPPKSWSQFLNQRLRYASKGFNYPVKVAFGLSLYVIFNLLFPIGLILGLVNNAILNFVFVTIIIKAYFEYKLVRKAARILGDSRFTNYYFITSILHIPYVLFFGIFGQFKFFKWAENKVEHGVLEKTE